MRSSGTSTNSWRSIHAGLSIRVAPYPERLQIRDRHGSDRVVPGAVRGEQQRFVGRHLDRHLVAALLALYPGEAIPFDLA